MNAFLSNDFIFNSRYRLWRHLIYWSFHSLVWAIFWIVIGTPVSYGRMVFNMILWVPGFILFSYPLVYAAIPYLLLKGRVLQFFLFVIAWGAAGLYIDVAYRNYIFIPVQEAMGLNNILPRGPLAFCYLCMTTSAASPMTIKFYKLWTLQQKQWLQARQEKITAELQLLKAQVHPHFLFNTLNNIYAFALQKSPKTPGLILKLSSLLSYMLYDCKTELVRLEKEIENMKNYVDLEKERYGERVEVSWSVEGDIKDKMIAPLFLLTFLKNAFKHCIADSIDKPWVSVDLSVNKGTFSCKIVNSKVGEPSAENFGTGIINIKKRLESTYPGRNELKIHDETDFFVVNLQVQLYQDSNIKSALHFRPVREEPFAV